MGARGGNGGQATGTLEGSFLDEFYASYSVVPTGGAGGAAYGIGGKGGNGGTATGSGRIDNPAGLSNLSLQATGGAGGAGLEGADGGDGASTALTNAVSGSGLDSLRLNQSAYGGKGGDSTSAVGGRGGDALSELARVSAAQGQLRIWVDANGGQGGHGSQGTGGSGGSGRATLDLQHAGGAVFGTVMARGGAPGDAALRNPGSVAGQAEATGRVVGSASEFTDLSVFATGGEAGQRYDTRNTANRIWLGNGGQATAQGHAEGGGRVSVQVRATGGQGERGGDAAATASARGTSPLANVFADAGATSPGSLARSSAVAELSTNQIATPVRAKATAFTSGANSDAEARSTSGYTGERSMVIGTSVQSSDASATAHAATGVGGLTERYDTYGPFGYSILIGAPSSDQIVLTPQVAQMYADGQTPLLAQGGVGTGPAMTFGKTALSDVSLDARLQTVLADNERAFIGLLDLQLNNVDVPNSVFGNLSFSVDNHGTELFKQEFTSLEEARAYFADRPIVLDSATGNVDLGLHFSVVGALSSGWRINYVIGVIPEPSTQALMALAFGGLFAVRRWQARRGAVMAA